MIGRRQWTGGVISAILGLALAACSQQGQGAAGASPQPTEKTFTLSPSSTPVQVGFLAGQLQDLRVTEQIEAGTGKVVDPPWFHATLKLKNVSGDQAARLISGKLQYLGPDGKPIALAADRRDTSFSFNGYQTDRLDPGMQTSQEIEIPFPAAALGSDTLRNIRLELTYTPQPYKEESVTVPLAVKG
jgi:hypothetical protein